MKTAFPALCAGFSLGLFLACGGTPKDAKDNCGTIKVDYGTMKVVLASEVDRAYAGSGSDVNPQIQAVEIKGGGEWIDLGSAVPVSDPLADVMRQSEVPAGHYSRMRLVLTAGVDAHDWSLLVPPILNQGIDFDVDLEVVKDTVSDIAVLINPYEPFYKELAPYPMLPACEAIDRGATGSITGIISNREVITSAGRPLIHAETLDAQGVPHIVRSCTAKEDGSYTLDLLPLGATYHVVSMMEWGSGISQVTEPIVSDAIVLPTTPGSTASFDMTFMHLQLQTWGIIRGSILPPAGDNQLDYLMITRDVELPSGGTGTFILDLGLTYFVSGQENFRCLQSYAPPGGYLVHAVRTTWNTDGTTSSTTATPVPVGIAKDGTVNSAVTIQF